VGQAQQLVGSLISALPVEKLKEMLGVVMERMPLEHVRSVLETAVNGIGSRTGELAQAMRTLLARVGAVLLAHLNLPLASVEDLLKPVADKLSDPDLRSKLGLLEEALKGTEAAHYSPSAPILPPRFRCAHGGRHGAPPSATMQQWLDLMCWWCAQVAV